METYATINELRTALSEANKENFITDGQIVPKCFDTNEKRGSEIVITPAINKSSVTDTGVAVAVINNNEVVQPTKSNSKQRRVRQNKAFLFTVFLHFY